MSYARITFAAAGFGLLTMATFAPALADKLPGISSVSTPVPAAEPITAPYAVASFEAGKEIPLGLLIKTPETPHGVSFNRKVASSQSDAPIVHG